MPSDYTRVASSDAPPAAANVATAYPPGEIRSSSLSRTLAIVTFFGAILVLLVHYVDHPATQTLKSAFGDAVSSMSGGGKSPPVADVDDLPTSKRLAICFSGDVGTLSSVADQNIKTIYAADPSASVFYYLNLQDDYYNEGTGEHYTDTHDLESLQPVFDASKPVTVKSFYAADVSVPPQSDCHKKEAETRDHYSHNYMQFYAADRCYKLIKEAEESAGERFGWILRLQPNMKIRFRMPEDDVKPRVHMSGSAMALIPRQMADAYFSVVDAFSHGKCSPIDAMGGEPCKNYSYNKDSTECLIIKWLKQFDIIPSNGVYVNRRIAYPEDVKDE